MDKLEAQQVAEAVLEALRADGYQGLIDQYLGRSEQRTELGDSGVEYQVEIQAFWDSGSPGDLRVIVAIDDAGWRVWSPLSTDFIVAPDGSFVGE